MFLLASSLQAEQASAEVTPQSYLILGLLMISTALLLYCIFTIHRNPHFTEMQKLIWLLVTIMFPLVGPLAWFIRLHYLKKSLEEDS